jgi:simple sugar transport system ATP-binding protein
MRPLLEMSGITKSYGAVRANRAIDLTIPEGRVVGLLGENGSGKSTLMKVLFGMVAPDAGKIVFRGRQLQGHRPREAIAAGIGMIHQHFTLVEAMTVVENVMLSLPATGLFLDRKAVAARIDKASRAYGLDVDPQAVVSTLSFGFRQRVEIVKAIMSGAKLLILDEPTSILSPPEVSGLLNVIRKLREQEHSIVFISHKLPEVLEICDEVVVLRDGAVSGQASVRGATREQLARMMVERDLSAAVVRGSKPPGATLLRIDGLKHRDAAGTCRVDGVDLSVCAGEILAIAGVDGNGQAELLDTLAGVLPAHGGSIRVNGVDITRKTVNERLASGLAYIPVDRAATSLVPTMSITDNLAMRDFTRTPLSRGPFLRAGAMRSMARQRIQSFAIRSENANVPVKTLSGGNQQKIVLAREIGRRPKVLIAFQPTWGLDPGATRFVIDQILALRDEGSAILYVSTELEEVLMLGDRVAVMSEGRLSRPEPRRDVDVTRLGLMMAGAGR